MCAMLPLQDVIECEHIVSIRAVFLLSDAAKAAAIELEHRKVDAGRSRVEAQLLIPVGSHPRCLRQIDVVRAVAAEGQRVDHLRSQRPVPAEAENLTELIDRPAAGLNWRRQIRVTAGIGVFPRTPESPDFVSGADILIEADA